MSVGSGAMPIERSFIRKVWLIHALAIVALAIVLTMMSVNASVSRSPRPEPDARPDAAVVQRAPDTIEFNGHACHQCR